MSRFTRSLALLAVLVLVAAFGAGCGGSGDDDAADARLAADQEERALASEAKSTVKAYVNAVETCAVQNLDGSYTGCLEVTRLVELDPPLEELPGETTIGPGTDEFSYEVSTTLEGGTFTERHTETGSIEKTCEPSGTPRCEDGTW